MFIHRDARRDPREIFEATSWPRRLRPIYPVGRSTLDAPPRKDLNHLALTVFAPLLILTGALGLLLPERHFQWKMVDAVLHVAIGTALIVIGWTGRGRAHPVELSSRARSR